MSLITGTVAELIYQSLAAGTAKNTFTSEAQINDTTGMGVQALLPPNFWTANNANAVGRTIRIVARGILSSTGTPTYTFTCRLGTAGSTSAAIALGSAALTTGSGVSNQYWEFQGEFTLTTIGAAGANSHGVGVGSIVSPGLATTINPLWGGAATPGTITNLDTSITNYINFNVACSASSASNTITLQQLLVFGLN